MTVTRPAFELTATLAELRAVTSEIRAETGTDRLCVLAKTAAALFDAIDRYLIDGGSLPIEWNPYIVGREVRKIP